MDPDRINEYTIRDLINKLNYYTKKYDEGNPEIGDKEWDDMYFDLQELESWTGLYFEDSPTQRVNYAVVNELNKIEHNHKMLSLDKTKDTDVVKKFVGNHDFLTMAKMDGLTCSLRYVNGKLVSAETRGNGLVGEDILHNAITLKSIPNKINYTEELIVDGEVICSYSDFEQFSTEYANPRNFASGSIRLLDAAECSKRNLTFVAWEVIKGFEEEKYLSNKLLKLDTLGFTIVPFEVNLKEYETIEQIINIVKKTSYNYPIDGMVFKFDDIEYGKTLGETGHHFKNAIAYKFYDEEYETILENVEWTMGRTGVLSPIAIFKPVEIDGTTVERASLSNVSIMEQTLGKPYKGQKIWVSKRNMIIPKVERAEKE